MQTNGSLQNQIYLQPFETDSQLIQKIPTDQDKLSNAVQKIQRFGKWIFQTKDLRRKRIVKHIMNILLERTIQVTSIQKIQSLWRGYQVRKQYSPEINKKIIRKVGIIQKAVRRYLFKQKTQRQNNAARLIQGFFKMITLSHLFQKMRQSALIIQRNYRIHLWEISVQSELYQQYVIPMEETLQQTKSLEANALWTIGCDPNSEFQQIVQQEQPEEPLSFSLLDKCIQSYRPRLNKMCLFLYPIDLDVHCDLNDQYNPNYSYSRTLLNLIVQQIIRDHPIQTIHLTEQSTLCVTLGGSSIYEFGTALFFAPHDEESQLQVQKLLLPDHIKIKTLSTSDTHLLMTTADGSLLQFGVASKPISQGKSFMPQVYNIRSFVGCATNYTTYAISDNHLYKLNQKIPQKVNLQQQVKTCCAGLNFAAVLCKNGTIFTWGENFEGELGQGDTRVRLEPTLVQTLTHERIVQLSCGLKHMSARSSLNRVYTWGWGQMGQLGQGSLVNITLPQQVLNKHVVLWAVCGRTQTLVITSEFTIMCSGTNSIVKEQCLFEPFPLGQRSKALDNPNYIPIRVISTYSKSLEFTYITYANITSWLEDNHNKRSKVLKKLIKIWSESNDWGSVDPPFHQSLSNHIYEGSMRKIQPDHNPKVGLYFLRQQQQYRDEQNYKWEKRKQELLELLRGGIKNESQNNNRFKPYSPIQRPVDSKIDSNYYQIPYQENSKQEHYKDPEFQQGIRDSYQFQQESPKEQIQLDSFREPTQFSLETPQQYPGPLFQQNSSKKVFSGQQSLLDNFIINQQQYSQIQQPLFKQDSSKFEQIDQYGSFSGTKQVEITRDDKLLAIKKHLTKIQGTPNDEVDENDLKFLNKLYKSKLSPVLLEILKNI